MEWCIVIAALVTLKIQARRLPIQNIVAISFLVVGLSFVIELFSEKTGLPIARGITRDLPPAKTIANVSWLVPLLWLISLLNVRTCMKQLLRTRQGVRFYGSEILMLTSVTVSVLYTLAPLFFKKTLTPLNLPGTFFMAVVLLLSLTPWLIEKKPRSGAEQ